LLILSKKYNGLFSDSRYFVVTGGRGSGKSFSITTFLLTLTYETGHVILFTRYTLTSAHVSIIPEFIEKIDLINRHSDFHITKDEIINVRTGSKILFKGIKTSSGQQTANLKSLSGVTTWVLDEAEELTDEETFDKIDYSIRHKDKQNRVILVLNPATKEHFIYQKFFENKGVEGGTATITVRDGLGGTIVYESTQGISGEIVADWYAFLYGDATIPLRKVVFENVPPYVDAHVTVKISSDGYVKLGAVLLGVMHELGIAGYGASVSLVDYSIKKTDDFGKTTFVRRGFKEKIELTVQLEKFEFNRVHNHLLNLRSTPWFLVVADDPDLSEALYMFGYYNSYRNVIEAPTFTLYSLEFESLVN